MKKYLFILLVSICLDTYSQPSNPCKACFPAQAGQAGKFLQTNGHKAVWAPVVDSINPVESWNIHGNEGTDTLNDYLGTTDGKSIFIQPDAGNIGIGQRVANYKLDVLGQFSFETRNDKSKLFVASQDELFQGGYGFYARYFPDSNVMNSNTVVHMGTNLEDWGDTSVFEVLSQHPDYGAVWWAQLRDARTSYFIHAGSSSTNVLLMDTNKSMFFNSNIPDPIFTIFAADKRIQYLDGNEGSGKVLVSDDNGIATWQSSPIITTGTTAPSSTPNKVGDIFIDTAGKKLYFATGVSSSADWVIAN